MGEITHSINIEGKQITVKTGKLAPQAAGSAIVQMGNTTILAAVTFDDVDAQMDYFPLGVEYIEKMYARAAISGSRYQKREGHPSEEAIIKARQVDHSIRSLFPKSFKKPTSVVLTVLTYDEVNDPENLTVLAASIALMQAGIPFMGPCSSVVCAVDNNNEIIINPTIEQRHKFDADFVLSAVDGKILNMEGWAKEVTEETMDKLIDKALAVIATLNDFQREFCEKTNAQKPDFSLYNDIPAPEEMVDEIKKNFGDKIKTAIFNQKVQRDIEMKSVKKEVVEYFDAKEVELNMNDISNALDYIARKYLREGVLKDGKRISGRKLDELRPLMAEVDLLPVVHGSALFQRELTQSLSIATLAPKSQELLLDDMMGESSKTFMHHYVMPNFSTGEAGRYDYRAGRREIGHGSIGENALKNVIPSIEDFPYTIRVVSEITSSNGSTSMAATCASSMALMAAGVPMKEAVAGIGVGLVTEDGNEDNYRLLLDIEGTEDFFGDMDFKVCGTKNGITAMQYENKLRGVKPEILKEAFRLAKTGRLDVLDVMNEAISAPRESLPENAPVVAKISIDPERIGELIGPGGKNIKEIVESAAIEGKPDADINIEDDGSVLISAANTQQLDMIKERIESMFKVAEIGEEYECTVDRIATFGLFAGVPSTSIYGLIHISEITDAFVSSVEGVFEEGDVVRVKVIGKEDGKTSMSMKGLPQSELINTKIEKLKSMSKDRPARSPRMDDQRRGGPSRNSRSNERRRY